MTEQMLKVILETATAKADKDGWVTLPEGRLMTLHAAHDGVALTVGKVEAVHTAHGIARARTMKGDIVVVAVEDMFGATIEGAGESAGGRKAGFLG